MIRNRMVALIFRSVCLLLIVAGIAVQIGVFDGTYDPGAFMYYTIQSNLLALVLFGLLLFKTVKGYRKKGTQGSASYFPRFEMVCVIDLLLTFFVYWLMLAPTAFSMGNDLELWSFGNVSVHLLTPLFCLIDYVLFSERGRLKYRDVYAVLIFPLLYVLFTTIAGFAGYVYLVLPEGREVHFPYYFLEFDQIGSMVFVYIAVLVVFFLVVSHGFYLFDRKRKKLS